MIYMYTGRQEALANLRAIMVLQHAPPSLSLYTPLPVLHIHLPACLPPCLARREGGRGRARGCLWMFLDLHREEFAVFATRMPLSSELGTCKTVTARFRP